MLQTPPYNPVWCVKFPSHQASLLSNKSPFLNTLLKREYKFMLYFLLFTHFKLNKVCPPHVNHVAL